MFGAWVENAFFTLKATEGVFTDKPVIANIETEENI